MNMEELAYETRMRKKSKVKFVVKHFATSGNGSNDPHKDKNIARSRIIRRYRSREWPGPLKILTMPSFKWCFERALLASRKVRPLSSEFDPHTLPKHEYDTWVKNLPSLPTRIIACENNDAIYRISLKHIPKEKSQLSAKDPWTFTTDLIEAYHKRDVFDIMSDNEMIFDVAWIDLLGFVSNKRFNILQDFFRKRVKHELTITSMTARYDSETQEAFSRFENYKEWLCSIGEVVDTFEYNEGTPFFQVTFKK